MDSCAPFLALAIVMLLGIIEELHGTAPPPEEVETEPRRRKRIYIRRF